MREFAASFYSSRPWQDTRLAYKKSKGGLCEKCLKEGRYTAGEIVHHKIPLSPENINNPHITLDWSNLQLLCRDCHGKVHDKKGLRYKFDSMGRVVF